MGACHNAFVPAAVMCFIAAILAIIYKEAAIVKKTK